MATIPLNLQGLLKRSGRLIFPRVANVCCILYDSKRASRVTFGVAHSRRNISSASRCNDLVLRSKEKFYISIHHVFGHAGNAGNECADIAASFGTSGFNLSVQRTLLWADQDLPLTHIAERLHDARSRLLLG